MYHIICISQVKSSPSYQEIRKSYDTKELNDETALPYIQIFIKKAKENKDCRALALAYRDAVAYSSGIDHKLKFADSTILASSRTKNSDLISDAYLGKGILYSVNLKKYQPALSQFLKAYHYSRNSKDDYLKHKVNYHLGNVKSYLGFYEEAITHFGHSVSYFEKGVEESTNASMTFNYKKGYYNILHQMTVCYRNLNNVKKSDSLIKLGLKLTEGQNEFLLENSYFLKCKGLLSFYKNNPNDAVYFLNKALPQIVKKKDFMWASVIYYYLGEIYINNGEERKGVMYFTKIDSIFNKNKFIFPEVRKNYEFLISHYQKENNSEKELYYTKQLVKADNIIVRDYKYLSKKIFREYDSKRIKEEQEKLENSKLIAVFFAVVILIGTIVILLFRQRREKILKRKYAEIQEKLLRYKTENTVVVKKVEKDVEIKKKVVSDEKANELAIKLKDFESKKKFLQKGLTCKKLADQLKTNSNYLSMYINDVKGYNFNKYLAELRINYITELLHSDKEYRKLTIEALAGECGIASRQNFSDLFYEINGIRPTDFIKMRIRELNKD